MQHRYPEGAGLGFRRELISELEAGVPDAIAAKLNAAVEYAVTRPDVQKLFADRNIETRASKPEEMAKLIRDEMAQWGEVVKRSNIRMD